MAEDIYVASESAMLKYDGAPVVVHKGTTTVRAGHALLEAYPELFEPLDVTFDLDNDGDNGGGSEEPDVDDELPAGVAHVGAGWYEVDGVKVRGRDAAVKRAVAAEDDAEDDGEGDDGE